MDRKPQDAGVTQQVRQRSVRLRVALHGAVQGVGFRPFVHRLATEMKLGGWVNNSPQGVYLEAEGLKPVLDIFLERLQSEKPRLSFVQSMESSWLDPAGFDGFEIRASEDQGQKNALVLPDMATCEDCLAEIFDPANRRFRYPFTNCTHCGPRFSIIEALPYDRVNTSMKQFEMCPLCRGEYDDSKNRRFHAQPNACPVCGPNMDFWDGEGRSLYRRLEALRVAAEAIRQGQIVAVKGIGGFHLMADARNKKAVQRLRDRKRREEKPFALLFPTQEKLRSVCRISSLEERLLLSPEAPIVLLERINKRNALVAESVAPGNPNLAVMLPSNPIHHLLMAALDFPVVATSGNLSDEPICIDEAEAVNRLRGIADYLLVHNRPIVRHVDDSIVRIVMGREMVLRRARGYAPLPIRLQSFESKSEANGKNHGHAPKKAILAVGAHLKNSVALAISDNIFVSQHIGDLETVSADKAFRRVIADLQRIYNKKAGVVVSDLHPDYSSSKFAEETGLEQVKVQHHIAHAWSCIAENEIQLPALCVAWDGTGFGPDGTVWGGEFFEVRQDKVERVASFRPFHLPGSNAAVKEPRRSALGVLFEIFGDSTFDEMSSKSISAFTNAELALLKTMLNRNLNSPKTSSVGRLFDAVASILGLRQQMRFEGQAAMELEVLAGDPTAESTYPLPGITRHGLCLLDWEPMIREILGDVREGVAAGQISTRFHNTLAESIVTVAERFGQSRVALSGGCFQNRYLLERTVSKLRAAKLQPYWHQRIPTNDGGIALGQVMAVRQQHFRPHN